MTFAEIARRKAAGQAVYQRPPVVQPSVTYVTAPQPYVMSAQPQPVVVVTGQPVMAQKY